MADTQFNDAFDDELLSAYVDGELSADRVAQVEQRLSEDPRARQLVAELRALSDTLRAMPREMVSVDLRGAVLRQAELLPKERDGTGGVRRWSWAAMALAAMLLLMVFQPDGEREEQPLASVDAGQEKAVKSIPEFRAPIPGSEEADEEVAEGKAIFAESVVAKPQAAAVDELEVLDRAGEEPEIPVQEVHLVLADSGGGFDKMLVSNGLVRVSQWKLKAGAEIGRARRMALGERQSGLGGALEKEASQVVEVLAEGTAEQIEKMLFACLADQRRYSELRGEKKNVGTKLYSRSSLQSGVVALEESSEPTGNGGTVESLADADRDDVSGLSADEKRQERGRVQVLFVLHPAPQPVKPAEDSKKARKSEKAGGKEG